MSDEIKIWKISGKYVRKFQRYTFTKYIRAMTEANAIEKVISQITSQRLLRRKVELTEIKTVSLEECPDLYMHGLAKIQ